MSFVLIATISSIVLTLIGLGWIFAGKLLFMRWSIDANQDGVLVGRRLGAVYVGIAIILFLGRSSPASDLRSALCIGMIFVMSSLATLGIFEFIARRVNAVILASSAIEVLLAIGFAYALLAA